MKDYVGACFSLRKPKRGKKKNLSRTAHKTTPAECAKLVFQTPLHVTTSLPSPSTLSSSRPSQHKFHTTVLTSCVNTPHTSASLWLKGTLSFYIPRRHAVPGGPRLVSANDTCTPKASSLWLAISYIPVWWLNFSPPLS